MTLVRAIMNGHDVSKDEANEIIEEMKVRVHDDHEDPEEVLYDYGLEPDYIHDLL